MKSSLISFLTVAVALAIHGSVQVSAFSPITRRIQLQPTGSQQSKLRKHSVVSFPKIPSFPSEKGVMMTQGDVSTVDSSTNNNGSAKSVALKLLTILGVAAVIWKRQALSAILSYIKNEWLLTTLDRLSAAGPAGLILYTVVFMLWEMTFGITTPVETAAGVAFGAIPGILASGTGKFLGALFTFLLARYSYADQVRKRMENNELLSLMEESAQETPFRVALLSRFSPLPELVKNAGMGVLPVPKRWYMASLIVHGFSFTCLWTCMGAETGRVIRGLPPSSTLKILVTSATWIGFGAPVMIGIWIKSLREKQMKRRQQEEDAGSSAEE